MENVAEYRAPGRALSSWIDGFLEHTEGIQSSELHRLWAGIAGIAGALERKVWIHSQRRVVYPNLYIFLVGPPGSGKTYALQACRALWQTLKKHHVAPVSLTKAALMDRLARADRIFEPPMTGSFNSLLIASGEFGALLPNYDADFLNALTNIYDNDKYDEERRGIKDPLIIEAPQINLIACTTPSFLTNTMPAGAWEQGFLARVIIAYNDLTDIAPLNLLDIEAQKDTHLTKALREDLNKIGARQGRLLFTGDAAKLIEAWSDSGGGEIKPTHPRLIHYNRRRTMHLLKLCMIACIDRGAQNIDVPDFQCALNWMTQVEFYMADVFTAMSSGGDAMVINDCWHYALTKFLRDGKGLTTAQLWSYLQAKVPSYSISKIVEAMLRAGLIEAKGIGGDIVYMPKTKG